MKIGAHYLGQERCEFVLWAPRADKIALKLTAPDERILSLKSNAGGYWKLVADGVPPGTRYLYRLNESVDRPDPASHSQPDGVHSASEVVDHNAFEWQDENWTGVPLEEMVLYELHVGAFTNEGTFTAVIPRLSDLKELGVNAIELMPVAQFPGQRNWGYDGVYPFAVQDSYGGPKGLKELVQACHQLGLAVVLDVVYNHLGPEGNYLRDFGPYFTQRYHTPWGEAVNFDGPYSDEVRRFFIENALHWFRDYHIDALRLDAIHAIYDFSARPFLQQLAETVEEFSTSQSRKYYLIAESSLNDTRVIRPRELGGFGLDAQWNDDFHHSLRTLLTAEREGYYADFGKPEHFEKAMRQGFVYTGEYSRFRKRRHGNDSADRPAQQFVVCTQNHDQVGNRMLGERLSKLVSFEALKLAAGAVLLSPYVPLLFMGEEYGEESPFLYFVDHSDAGLIDAVRKGRKAEFESFSWQGEPPDPKSEQTLLQSTLNWQLRSRGKHKILLAFYQKLLQLRRDIHALAKCDNKNLEVLGVEQEKLLSFRRWQEQSQVFCTMNFNDAKVECTLPLAGKQWHKLLDSADENWLGPGSSLPPELDDARSLSFSPLSFVLYESSK